MQAKRWTVEVFIDELGPNTRAWAVLTAPGHTVVQGSGTVHLDPGAWSDSEIGDELATGHALVDLGHRIERLAAAGGVPREADTDSWWESL